MTDPTERARVIGELRQAQVTSLADWYELSVLVPTKTFAAALRLLEADAGREVNVVELAEADAERRFGAASPPAPAQEGA
jgi:hypothetical protein